VGERILAGFAVDWRIPHHLAKAILTDPAVRSRDLALALKATTQTVEMTKQQSSDAPVLHAHPVRERPTIRDG
jgi:hypothetical protein